jgi:hypothetical protein
LIEEGQAMKCQECGFVSFDNLSECRRCGADLTEIRERLGFSTLKSEVPFLLGPLLKDGGKRDHQKDRLVAGIENEGKESASGSDFGRLIEGESLPGEPATILTHGARSAPPAKEELIIELSEADLESLCGTKEPIKGKEPRKTQ